MGIASPRCSFHILEAKAGLAVAPYERRRDRFSGFNPSTAKWPCITPENIKKEASYTLTVTFKRSIRSKGQEK